MPRGSKNLPEQLTMVRPADRTRAESTLVATTKADYANLLADGYRVPDAEGTAEPPADAKVVADVEAAEHERRSEAAKKAADTRRRNAAEDNRQATNETTETPDSASATASTTLA